MHVLHKNFFSQILFFNKVFNSVTPTRCPANQLISDTNYPELDKPHTVQGLSRTGLQVLAASPRIVATYTSDQRAINKGFP